MAAKRRQSVRPRTARAVEGVILAAVLLAGANLMTLATGSDRLSWVGWFALIPLFLAIRVCRPFCALRAGALWGFGLCMFAGLRGDTGIVLTAQSVLLLAGAPAVYAGLGAWLTHRIGFSPFVLGVGWIGVELALQPVGLDLGLLAVTQGDCLWVAWVSHALGYALAAFAVAYVNALLLEALASLSVGVPRSLARVVCGDLYRSLKPQAFLFTPRLALELPQPRAPPAVRAP